MATWTCFHCGTESDLATAVTNRCPTCEWITEIYYDRDQAEEVARIYNEQEPPLPDPSGVTPLRGINGYAVSFPDQQRMAEVAARLIAQE